MKPKDAAVALAVTGAIVALGSLVTATVLSAQKAGRVRLEQLQTSQVEQLARGMNSRVEQVFTAFQGIVGAPPAFHVTPNDPNDLARLTALQNLNPAARTGYLIVDISGQITTGTLLRAPAMVGHKVDLVGLDGVLAGKAGILPVGPGLTTSLPTIVIAYPLRDASGRVLGAFLAESDVSPSSPFNLEISQLAGAKNADYSFVDSQGAVVASSDHSLLAKPLDDPLAKGVTHGITRGNGELLIAEPVPAANWRVVFRQPVKDFEGTLTEPLHSALLLLALLTIALAGASGLALVRQLRRARREQQHLTQLAQDREEFISIVSHELRTPVTGLLGFLQTTLDHWDDMGEGDRRRAVTRAVANASRLHALSRDVLDASAIESGHLEYMTSVIDLRDVLTSAVMTEQELHPARTLSLTTPNQPVWVNGDGERLQQVVLNLLENGIKASPPEAPLAVALDRSTTTALLTVRDQGPGLSPEDLDRAFDKFVRGRSRTVGSGLGLYICRQIVAAHDGEVTAENAPDGGAVFSVRLPTCPAPNDRVDAAL